MRTLIAALAISGLIAVAGSSITVYADDMKANSGTETEAMTKDGEKASSGAEAEAMAKDADKAGSGKDVKPGSKSDKDPGPRSDATTLTPIVVAARKCKKGYWFNEEDGKCYKKKPKGSH